LSLNEEVDLLRKIPLFAKIDPVKLKLLAFASERLTFPSGQELFHQGDPGDTAYIIMDGEVDIAIDSPAGEIVVARMGQNELIGEIAILIDVPRTATVRASSQVTTLAISKDLFFRLVTEFPDMAVEIMRELAHRLENTNAQLREARSAQTAH
jgi:CRP/FNR family cyclic AMP-dependent transcriptional regulator